MKGWTSLFEDYFDSWCDFFGINRKGEHSKEEATIRQIFYFDCDELQVRTLWMFHHRIKGPTTTCMLVYPGAFGLRFYQETIRTTEITLSHDSDANF